jgi:hypothetical protein
MLQETAGRVGVFAVLALTFTACKPLVTPPPVFPIAEAEFVNALSQPPMAGFLGVTPTIKGVKANWTVTRALPLALEWPQGSVAGEIIPSGTFTVKLPQTPDMSSQVTFSELVRGFNILSKHDCSIDTLTFTPPNVKAVELFLYGPNPGFTSANLHAQYTPAPPAKPYLTLLPLADYFNTVEHIFYLDANLSVQGELSCTSPYLEGNRYDLLVNINFSKGWNGLTQLYGTETIFNGERVQKMLLKGATTLNAMP